MGHTSANLANASNYFILQAFYERTVINGNNSAVLYKGNKAKSQMRSRAKCFTVGDGVGGRGDVDFQASGAMQRLFC